MKYYYRKIITVLKMMFLCIALSVSLLFSLLTPHMQNVSQTFDMKSSIVISLGFGTAICLFINNRKKE